MASDPQGPHDPNTPPSNVSFNAARVIGFLVAGAALVALADVAPQAAIGLTAVLGLGVLLTHADQLTAISNLFNIATGHPSPS